MFGEPLSPPAVGECTVTFSWLRTTFGVLPEHPTDEMVLMHARAYIWMLLSVCLFGDKTGARAHVRWLPFLLRIDDLVRMSPVSDIGGRGGARPAHSAGGTQSPQFGGVQNRPHRALSIDFLHAKDGRVSDQWFPQTFRHWHALWATRFEQLFQVLPSADPGPTADFIRWWILAGRRYLVPADRFHRLPPDEIPVEAVQRQSAPHPPRPDVPLVPDNRRPARRMMVGTKTTARDWQWLDECMAEDAPAVPPTQKNRRMPLSYGCRRGAGRLRRGAAELVEAAGRGVMGRLPSRLRAVPAPFRR
ncbi:hypothetical protein PIB30_023115 [Stylosanthes scabra]|uniref:Aminotransferase-like plant mobile domain-containing protein n=1 Tax=Stylosanthes scabra TaxID=79078 RepID=A0ABU6Q8Y6_9FABA|nr:hypothetical protein [Stylosanthes scabra]